MHRSRVSTWGATFVKSFLYYYSAAGEILSKILRISSPENTQSSAAGEIFDSFHLKICNFCIRHIFFFSLLLPLFPRGGNTRLSSPSARPCFIRNLIFGKGFRFLNFSILKAWNSLIHLNPFLNFQSARILRLREILY